MTGWDCHVHVFDPAYPCLPGHYAPGLHPLSCVEETAAEYGNQHLVLVQPSVYGTDNSLMLDALRTRPGRHRGIAVVDGGVRDELLDTLHAAGTRGIRFNLVSPVGNSDADLPALAPRLRSRGWHVQWYARPGDLARIAQLQADTRLVFVLDHAAGLPVNQPCAQSTWEALQRLAGGGAWLKLSGWYRLGAYADEAQLHRHIERVAGLFGERLVWGSDWPHTSLGNDMPAYASLWQPVVTALGPLAQRIAGEFPAVLYR